MFNVLNEKENKFDTEKFTTLDGNEFGEGCEKIGNFIYQLTWTSKNIFVYDENLKKIKEVKMPGLSEGWGITHRVKDGKTTVYLSDGSSNLYDCSIDPKTHEVTLNKKIVVKDKEGTVYNQLNELEYVDGYVYANFYMTNKILKIDADSGVIDKIFELKELEEFIKSDLQKRFQRDLYYGEVLNGIAYVEKEKKFYLTGKYWSLVFKVDFEAK